MRAFALLALLLPGLTVAVQRPLEVIDFQLRWKHQFQFAGYYAAIAQGYYREEGLDVRLHEGGPNVTPVEEVLSGRAQYGEANSELLYARLHGKPLVALAVIFQHSPSVLVARTDQGVRTVHDLIGFGALTPGMAELMQGLVKARVNLLVSGGTGSGKTTLLNVMSSSIPADERIITIEDAAELQLQQPHVVRMESRPPNIEG